VCAGEQASPPDSAAVFTHQRVRGAAAYWNPSGEMYGSAGRALARLPVDEDDALQRAYSDVDSTRRAARCQGERGREDIHMHSWPTCWHGLGATTPDGLYINPGAAERETGLRCCVSSWTRTTTSDSPWLKSAQLKNGRWHPAAKATATNGFCDQTATVPRTARPSSCRAHAAEPPLTADIL